MRLSILFEDAEALVIDKPAGLPLDRPRAGGHSLEDYADQLKLGFQRVPVPVHRLDRDTSGCLLLARNPKALKRLSAGFEARSVKKRYLGIVAGQVAGEDGEITLALKKISSEQSGWRMVPDKNGKMARTRWRRLDERNGVTLVEFFPETGRTHQIRVHATYGLGIALVGDPVYGNGRGSTRTLLHAAELVVPRERKTEISARAPLPDDFRALGFAVD